MNKCFKLITLLLLLFTQMAQANKKSILILKETQGHIRQARMSLLKDAENISGYSGGHRSKVLRLLQEAQKELQVAIEASQSEN